MTSEFAVAVSAEELEPVSIEAGDGKVIEAKPGEKLKIPVKVTRRAEVKAALKLKAAGLDAVKNVKELTVDPKADAATLELDLGQQKLRRARTRSTSRPGAGEVRATRRR